MKLALEARALSSPGGGVKTYVENLIAQLKQQPDIDLNIINGPRELLRIVPWLERKVPKQLKQIRPDIVHFTKAAIPHKHQFPTLVTIYDIIPILFPQSQRLAARIYWPQALNHAARVSDHIITISEASKQDIIKHLHVPPEKITVTPLAVDFQRFFPPVVKAPAKTPYILFVGTIEPRKNVPALIRAYAKIADELPHQLIIAGRAYKGLAEVNTAIAETKLQHRVQLLDFVSAENLPMLYQKAELFVWPSIYEGWGFPPQEAMAAGVPVIVSNGGSLPEVVGQAGIVVSFTHTKKLADRLDDEGFESTLAARMREVLADKEKQAKMRDLGLQRINEFSWEKVATITVEVYKKLL